MSVLDSALSSHPKLRQAAAGLIGNQWLSAALMAVFAIFRFEIFTLIQSQIVHESLFLNTNEIVKLNISRLRRFTKIQTINGKGEIVSPNDILNLRALNRLNELDIPDQTRQSIADALLNVNGSTSTFMTNMSTGLASTPDNRRR